MQLIMPVRVRPGMATRALECKYYFVEHANEYKENKVIHLCPQALTCKLYTALSL